MTVRSQLYLLNLSRLSAAVTEAQAAMVAASLLDEGVPCRDVARGLAEWCELRDAETQTVCTCLPLVSCDHCESELGEDAPESFRQQLRAAIDDSVLTHTGRSVGDIASERVADDVLAFMRGTNV